MNKIHIIVMVVFAVLVLNSGGYAMIESLSLDDLVSRSALIVIAKVEKISEVSVDKDQIKTLKNLLLPERILKGDWKQGNPIEITTYQAADEGVWIEDQMDFPPVSDKVVLFLEVNEDGKMTPVNTIQGIWPIDPEIGDYLKMGFGISEEQVLEAIKKGK